MPAETNLLHFPSATAPAAPLPVGDPPDQQEREKALDIQASWIVEAPAGSGKTGLLMQRYLKLLADPGVSQPEEVLAVTFTRKATAELRERVLSQLKAAARPAAEDEPVAPFAAASRSFARAVLERDAALGWNLLDSPQRLNIRTIDSVCADIANSMPLLSGSGAPRTPTERAEPLYRLAAQRTLMQLGGDNAALSAAIRDVLLHRDASLSDCETLLVRMLGTREQWASLVPLGGQLEDAAMDAEVRPRLERALEQIVCAGLGRAVRALPGDALQALSWLASEWSHHEGYDGNPSPLAICRGLQGPPDAVAEHLDHWCGLIHLVLTQKDWRKDRGINARTLGFELPKGEKQKLVELIEGIQSEELRDVLQSVRNLPPARYPDAQWAVAKSLFRLLVHALAELKVLFAERDECDFVELSIAAKQALRPEADVDAVVDGSGVETERSLRHLLVDEMQDTSASQYELIELLTRSWDGHSQTLFLVGDPKQSIYLFRQARVERFLRTMRSGKLGDIPIAPLRLTANFRSDNDLVDNFNQNFSLVFSAPDAESSDLDVPFVAAESTRAPLFSTAPASANPTFQWHASILEDAPDRESGDKRLAERHARKEAREIRAIIESWRDRPLPPGRTKPWRIAVLVRVRSHLSQILTEFGRPGADGQTIPFRATDIERLSEQPEVLDMLALTRALLHPADRVAWLAVLHAPWCGLGVSDLLVLSGGGDPKTSREPLPAVFASRRDGLSPEGRQLFERTWQVLNAALDQRGRHSTAAWVERTWHSLGGDLGLSQEQKKNVHLFLQVLRESDDSAGYTDIAKLEDGVDRLFAEPQPAGDHDFIVDLSTIHRAKGLEWDVVLVPGLERKGMNNRPELLNWLELDSSDAQASHVVLAPIYGRGLEPDKLYTWLSGVRSKREAAERKRLFYVACTRAREELHLFAATTRKQDGELSHAPGSLLEQAWHAAEPHFQLAVPVEDSATGSIAELLRRSLEEEQEEDDLPLSIAAGAVAERKPSTRPILHRLPLSVDPLARFQAARSSRLPYPQAAALVRQASFHRPEGSYAVRAFGNVVHRFLQLMANRVSVLSASHADAWPAVTAEIPNWLPRLQAAFRAESLPPTVIDRLAHRALQALQTTAVDATGRWLLSPHPSAYSERALRLPNGTEIRVDRTFLAGVSPLSEGTSHLWIVDFKTTEQGSHTDAAFRDQERAKYGAQLAFYAQAQTTLQETPIPVVQGLYYPLISRLLHW